MRWAMIYLTVAALAALTVACGGTETNGAVSGDSAFRQGESLFATNCSICHGSIGEGTQTGPPLVHAIYNPNHHPDFSFHNAVNNGVPQHHWVFGDMAPRPGLDEMDVDNIICYIRQLQVNEGIYDGEVPC